MNYFDCAQTAFEYYYNYISLFGEEFDNTKSIFNEGFYIENPSYRNIDTQYRKWKKDYAENEWNWYMSANPDATEIAKSAKIWLNMMNEDGTVNSNYGYQWNRGNQIEYVVNELTKNPNSRRASISLYDAKENNLYERDTICTYAINFMILHNKLNMSVLMRSNDLWYGFCNDQYCFSLLQEMIAQKLNVEVGTYYHFANNLHIYNKFLNKNN